MLYPIHRSFATWQAAILCLLTAASPALFAQTPALTVLYSLKVSSGSNPDGALVKDKNGALYGPALLGGAASMGSVIQLVPPSMSGGAWTANVLHSFAGGSDGVSPFGRLVFNGSNVLYGTTLAGGASNAGTLFQLTPPASGTAWTERVLYTFTGAADGGSPNGGLVFDKRGALYGAATTGGTGNNGTVFQLLPPATKGAPWVYTVLHTFTGGTADGSQPAAGLTMGPGGVLFGTTYYGGTANAGIAFELTPPGIHGGTWTETILYNFGCGADSGNPDATLTPGPGGVFYGTSAYCGSSNSGTIFQLTPPATAGAPWTETVLYTFPHNDAHPYGGVVLNSNSLFGTTYAGGTSLAGDIYQLVPPSQSGGAWTHNILYSFSGVNQGSNPFTGVLFGGANLLYGTTLNNGSFFNGTIFQLTF